MRRRGGVFRRPRRVERGAMMLTPGTPDLIGDAALERLAAESIRFTAERVGV